jgi:glycosyltransferase involved in cell wall biosynthesis
VSKLRIGINILWLLPGAAGGAEEYAIRVLRALDEEASADLDVTLFCNRQFPAAHPDLATTFASAVAPGIGASRTARIAIESTWLAREATLRRTDLVHHLNNVVPWVRNRPSVLTVHDLRPIVQPWTLRRLHGAYLRWRLPPSARASAVITTPSGFVRETVIELLGVDPDRVEVVSAPRLRLASAIIERPGLDIEAPFFVYPAQTNPHKNHIVLLKAFALVTSARPEARLVLTGPAGPAEVDVSAWISRLHIGTRVLRPGRVPAPHLNWLLSEAAGLVYPSRYEGFGLPLSDAMVFGCPVIAADSTALPEVTGDAGLVVDPDDVEGWAQAMLRMLDDGALRESLIAAGRRRVVALAPAETARRLVGVYRKALSNRRS